MTKPRKKSNIPKDETREQKVARIAKDKEEKEQRKQLKLEAKALAKHNAEAKAEFFATRHQDLHLKDADDSTRDQLRRERRDQAQATGSLRPLEEIQQDLEVGCGLLRFLC